MLERSLVIYCIPILVGVGMIERSIVIYCSARNWSNPSVTAKSDRSGSDDHGIIERLILVKTEACITN